jgi:hypothetical protein
MPKDRTIAKEPAYKSKDPRYCQLVFGPQAKQSVWLVIDAEDLYVDRNGNGDLTEDGERVTRKPAFQGGGFEVPKLDIGDGTTTYANLIVYWTRQPPGEAAKPERTVDVMVEVNNRYCQFATFKSSATAPKDAPVIHFGGPLEMVLLTGGAPLAAPGKEGELVAVIGTRSSTGHLAVIRHDRNLLPKADAHPVAEVTFPGKGGAKPVAVKVPLDQRCCNVRFNATLATPAEVGAGKATVTLSFPDWKDVKVGPTTKELAVAESTPDK